MSIDLSSLVESLQRAIAEIPPVAIALALLAGPTVGLIGYRLVVARRIQATPEVEVAPYWVCQECRSINALRLSRCYRCSSKRDAGGEIEVILDRPAGTPATFEVPAGSPFAALGASLDPAGTQQPGSGPGVPVMADPGAARVSIPVQGDQVGDADVAAGEDISADDRAPASERQA